MSRKLSLLALVALSFAVSASPSSTPPSSAAADSIESGVHAFNPKAVVTSVKDTPVSGLKEVQADGQVVYFSPDGKYLFAGDVYEVSSRRNLTEETRGSLRLDLLKTTKQKDHIVYGDAKNTKKIYVFTDTTCPYCARFHQEVPKLVAAGITVEYLAWPRSGPQGKGFDQMQSVWCSKDRAKAYDSIIAGKPVAPAKCDTHPIVEQYRLGSKLDVNGTPAIFDMKGVQLGGYVPAEQIIKTLAEYQQ